MKTAPGNQRPLGPFALRWAAVCIAAACFGFGILGRTESAADTRIVRRLSDSAAEQGRQVQREIARTGTVTNAGRLASDRAALLDRAAHAAGESTGAVLRIQAEFVREFGALVAELESCMKSFEVVGGADPATIRARQDLTLRRTALRHAARANRDVFEFARNMPDTLRARLAAGGVDPDAVARVIEGFQASNNTRQLVELRAQSARVLTAVDEVLGLLEEQWGNWRLSPEDGAVEFADARTADRYNALLTAVDQAARREAAMQARMLTARPDR